MDHSRQTHGFVLCGGASKRMGQDKALVSFLGRPLGVVQAEKLAACCDRVSLVSKSTLVSPFLTGWEVLPDEASEYAALHGIARALSHAESEWSVILAVDLPLVPVECLAALIELAGQGGAISVAPTAGGGIQPLCSVWHRSASSTVTSLVSDGRLSVIGALLASGGRVLTGTETRSLPGFFDDCFLNVNTPEELAKAESVARARWKGGE